MCKFIGKSNERILCKLSKSEILRLYSIVHVAMETTKTSHFTCQSKSFISIFFTCQVPACELQPFSCHDLANDIYSETAMKTVFSHLKWIVLIWVAAPRMGMFVFIFDMLCKNWFGEVKMEVRFEVFIYLFSVAKEECLQQSML